jgi:hypothetical protein
VEISKSDYKSQLIINVDYNPCSFDWLSWGFGLLELLKVPGDSIRVEIFFYSLAFSGGLELYFFLTKKQTDIEMKNYYKSGFCYTLKSKSEKETLFAKLIALEILIKSPINNSLTC